MGTKGIILFLMIMLKENEDLDYTQMATYYEQAKELCSGKEQDQEMDMLDVRMQEILDSGWI